MTDTPEFIRKKQIEIFLSKSEKDKWHLGLGMIDEVWNSVKKSILKEQPTLSEAELMVELFKRYYKKDFPPLVLEKISHNILLHHQQRNDLNQYS
jgi:hypothetical protein